MEEMQGLTAHVRIKLISFLLLTAKKWVRVQSNVNHKLCDFDLWIASCRFGRSSPYPVLHGRKLAL